MMELGGDRCVANRASLPVTLTSSAEALSDMSPTMTWPDVVDVCPIMKWQDMVDMRVRAAAAFASALPLAPFVTAGLPCNRQSSV